MSDAPNRALHPGRCRARLLSTVPALFALFALLVGCATAEARIEPFRAETPPTEVGDVVFIGEDGNVYTADSETGETVAVTRRSERYGGVPFSYHHAMWSPDGRRLSYAATYRPEGGERRNFMVVADIGSGETHVFESGINQPVAYAQWAPDSNQLTLLRNNVETGLLEVVLWNVDGGNHDTLVRDRPIFWDWSENGEFLVVHGGTSSLRSGDGTVSIVRFGSENGYESESVDVTPGFFQVPAISPTNDVFALNIVGERFGNAVALRGVSAGLTERVGTLFSAGAFGWAPDGERLAYISGVRRPTGEMVGTLRIVERTPAERFASVSAPEFAAPRQVNIPSSQLGGVNAFYWAPDGETIAFLRVGRERDESDRLTLLVALGFVDTQSGRAYGLPPRRPTSSLSGTIIPYFDQYTRSGTLFSPGGESFLLNVMTDENRPGIYIVDVETLEQRLIGHGHMPFYRPGEWSSDR